jgi:glycosyltransferase involved in cell wall biosynthesis
VPPGRLATIPLGLDVDGEAPRRERRDTAAILSIGQVIPRKRHEDAIRVLEALLPSFPTLRLWVAGPFYDEEYHQSLRRLAASLGLSNRVEFLGVRGDVHQLMAGSQVLLHCASSEAFGWVILEAWSAGLPVVASRSGGPEEVITDGETGHLVPTGDIPAFTKSVRALLDRPDHAAAIARNARKVLEEKYSARTMVERIAEVYRLVAGRGGRSSPGEGRDKLCATCERP